MIANINMFRVLFLYKVRSLEKWAKIITIDITLELIEKISCPKKLMATIRKDYIFSLSWRQDYYLLLVAHLRYYFISNESKVTSYRFMSFWTLYSVWIRMCYNRLIAKLIIDYLILTSIKQISRRCNFAW